MRGGKGDQELARVQAQLATAAADATPLAELDVTVRDLTRVQPLLQQVARAVAELLGTDRAVVWVTDPQAQQVYPAAWVGLPDDYIFPLRVRYGEGSAGIAVQQRKPVLVENVASTATYAPFLSGAVEHGITSAFSTPMLTLTGLPMGAVTAYFSRPAHPRERDRVLVETYARQAAEIVERARMHAEARELAILERRRSAQLRGLADAALKLTDADTVDDLLRIVTESAREIIGADQGTSSRHEDAAGPARSHVSLADKYEEWGEDHGRSAGGYLAAPLVSRDGRELGVIQLLHKADDSAFDSEDESMLVQLARMASSACDTLEAFERERSARGAAEEAARRSAVLSTASQAFAASLEPEGVAASLLDVVVPAFADWAALHLVSEDGTVSVGGVRHIDPDKAKALQELVAAHRVTTDMPYGQGAVLATGEPQLFPEIPDSVLESIAGDDRHLFETLRELMLHSGLVMPLTVRGKTIGAISLLRETPYDPLVDVPHVLDLCRRAALAIDNASRYTFERELAGALQRSLLPRSTPASTMLTSASRYLPGARGTQIGGDWYDLIEIDHGQLVFVVGDVMGRGVGAAAVMGQLRATVRAYALEAHRPAELLTRLDRVVQALDEANFTTCVIGLLDPATRQVCLSAAGHLPPLLISATGEAEFLALDAGLPLGVGGATFVEHELQMEPGSTLLLYTDGLVEGRSLPVDTGMAALRDAAAHPVRSAEELCDRVLRALVRDSDHDDDTALLALLLDRPDQRGDVAPIVLDLPATPAAAGIVRARLRDLVSGRGREPVADTASLLASELVGNAVRHAGGDIRVRAWLRSDLLFVEVCDSSERLPRLVGGTASAEYGRGLRLIEALADRWGADQLPTGKRVWFELSVDAPA